jgi:hypothetical protein
MTTSSSSAPTRRLGTYDECTTIEDWSRPQDDSEGAATFAGLFGAAPSVALATLGIAV